MRIGELNIGMKEVPVAESSATGDPVAFGIDEGEAHVCLDGGHIRQYPAKGVIHSRAQAEELANNLKAQYEIDPRIASFSIRIEEIRNGHGFGDLRPFAPLTYRIIANYLHVN